MPDQPAPDFEEARRLTRALREYADRTTGYIFEGEVYNLGAAADLIDALLNEREAREEVIRKLAASVQRRVEDDDALGATACDCYWCGEDRELLAALPATESAQADPSPTSGTDS